MRPPIARQVAGGFPTMLRRWEFVMRIHQRITTFGRHVTSFTCWQALLLEILRRRVGRGKIRVLKASWEMITLIRDEHDGMSVAAVVMERGRGD